MQERDQWPYRYVWFSENNYFVEFFGDAGYIEFIIHLFDDNVFIPNAVVLLTITDFDAMFFNDDLDNWDVWDNYTTYEINGVSVSAEVFNEHRAQYGLNYIWGLNDRTNDIEKINSMTILHAVPINNENNDNE